MRGRGDGGGGAGEEEGRGGRIEEKYEEAVEGSLRALTAMLLPRHLIWLPASNNNCHSYHR